MNEIRVINKKGKKMLYKKRGERDTVEEIVIALCRDYRRRQLAIEEGSASRRVLMEYAYLNSKMLLAAGEVTGGAYANAFIEDIGEGIGYAHSGIDTLSENTYKTYKRQIKRAIAKKLHLTD